MTVSFADPRGPEITFTPAAPVAPAQRAFAKMMGLDQPIRVVTDRPRIYYHDFARAVDVEDVRTKYLGLTPAQKWRFQMAVAAVADVKWEDFRNIGTVPMPSSFSVRDITVQNAAHPALGVALPGGVARPTRAEAYAAYRTFPNLATDRTGANFRKWIMDASILVSAFPENISFATSNMDRASSTRMIDVHLIGPASATALQATDPSRMFVFHLHPRTTPVIPNRFHFKIDHAAGVLATITEEEIATVRRASTAPGAGTAVQFFSSGYLALAERLRAALD